MAGFQDPLHMADGGEASERARCCCCCSRGGPASSDTKAPGGADRYPATRARRGSAPDPRRRVLATEARGNASWARTICFFKHPSANIYLATSWHVWGARRSQDERAGVTSKMSPTSGFSVILTLLISNKLQMSFFCVTAAAQFWWWLWVGSQSKKQIKNSFYQENWWNEILLWNEKLLSFSFWNNLKGHWRQHRLHAVSSNFGTSCRL